MGRFLNVMMVAALLMAGCGNTVTLTGVPWPWPWSSFAPFFAEKTASDTVPVTTQTDVVIEGINGEITVTGQPAATAVTIDATLKVGSDTLADAQLGLALIDMAVTVTASEILIQTQQPADPQGRQYLALYTITVPSGMVVNADQVNGQVTVNAVENTVTANQSNGDVLLTDVVGDTTVGVANGNIDATVTLPPSGAVQLTTGNGNIELAIPASTSAALSATVGNGGITWSGLTLTIILQTKYSLTATLGGGAGSIDLLTGNGSIHIAGF